MNAVLDRLDFRALRAVLPALGPRIAVVHDGSTGLNSLRPPQFVVVGLGDAWGSVRGSIDAWPLQSQSVTGVLVAVSDGDVAARGCRDAARVLQPGGVAAFFATWRADAVRGFDAISEAVGLAPRRRIAVRRAAHAGGLFPWIESRRAAAATGDERVVCVLTATAPGGHAVEYPTTRSVMSAMFVPRGVGRGRG